MVHFIGTEKVSGIARNPPVAHLGRTQTLPGPEPPVCMLEVTEAAFRPPHRFD
jgi:hypothetical protein